MKRWLKRSAIGLALAVGVVAVDLGRSQPVQGAEYLQIDFGLLGVAVPVADLRTFAETGIAPESLNVYLQYLPPSARNQFREVLNRRYSVSPVAVSQVTYSSIGEDFLTRLGSIIQTAAGLNGSQAMRAALILSASAPEGISILGILEAFPAAGIHIDGGRLLTLQQEVSSYFSYRDAALAAIAAQAAQEAAATSDTMSPTNWPDFRDPGDRAFNRTELQLQNHFPDIPANQPRNFNVDLFLPHQAAPTTPLVIISHGLGSNRAEFRAMAEHLASHGFAVAVPEHPGSDTNYQQEFLANLSYADIQPEEFVYRPWDVKSLIDYLATDPAYQQQIDLENIGVIGHSFGGYTALALAGAPLNQAFIRATCDPVQYVLNLSTLLQCRAAQLPSGDYQLSDDRVKAVMAYSPVTSVVFGPESLAQVTKPVMLIAASGDFVAPAVPEQIHPFLWLETPHKHLATFVPASHVSINGTIEFSDQVDISPQVTSLLTGPKPDLSSGYARAMNVAFMGVYLSDRPNYQQFLGSAYAAEFLSEDPIQLQMISHLTAENLISAYGGQPPVAIYPDPAVIRD